MISVPVNKDIEAFEETVAAGMNAKQLFAVIPTIILDIVFIYTMYMLVNINLTLLVYIAICPVVAVVLLVCRKKEGMTLWEWNKWSRKCKKLEVSYYQSTETPDYEYVVDVKSKEENEWNGLVKKIKIMAAFMLLTIIAVIVAICLLR